MPQRPGFDPFALEDDDPFAAGASTPPETTSRWGDYAGMALRGLSGFLASEGGWVGAGVAGAGDLAAQTAERFGGSRKAYNLLETGANAGAGAIPFGKVGGMAMRYLKGAGMGAGTNAAIDVAQQLGPDNTDPFDLGRVGHAATVGAAFGTAGAGVGHGLEKVLGGRAPAIAEAPAAAAPPRSYPRSAPSPPGTHLPQLASPRSGPITGLEQVLGIDPDRLTLREQGPAGLPRQPRLRPEPVITNNADVAGAFDHPSVGGTELRQPRIRPETVITEDPSVAGDVNGYSRPRAPEPPLVRHPTTQILDDPFQLPAGAQPETFSAHPAPAPVIPVADRAPVTPAGFDPANERRVRLGFAPDGVERRGVQKAPGGVLPDRPWSELAQTHPPGQQNYLQALQDELDALTGTPAAQAPAQAAQAAETGIENAQRRGKPFVPGELLSTWLKLRPKWQETAATSGIDPREDLAPFTQRVLSAENPRKLMGAERKAASQAKGRLGSEIPLGELPNRADEGILRSPAAKPLPDFLEKFVGSDAGGSGEAGQIDPELLRILGMHGGSALGSAAVAGATSDDETRLRNMLGAAAVGGVAPLAVTNPQLLGKLRYFSMLASTGAQAKNVLGNTGSTLIKAAEQGLTGEGPRGRDLLKAVFSRQTLDDAVGAFKNPDDIDSRWGKSSGALGVASRIMHAVDEGVTGGLERGGLDNNEARTSLFTSEPKSKTGKYLASRPGGPMEWAVPFVRTATNAVERGLEHTPGIGSLPAVKAMRDPSTKQQLARQGMGGAALAAAALGLTPDSPLFTALMGPLAIPSELGRNLRASSEHKGDPFSNAIGAAAGTVQRALPIPSNAYEVDPTNYKRTVANFLASFVPGALRDASPVDPKEFDTSAGVFDPAISKIPFLNEAMLRRKPKRPQAQRKAGTR